MYRGRELDRTSIEATAGLTWLGAAIALGNSATGLKIAIFAFSGAVFGGTASTELREQQFCGQPSIDVMACIGQSVAMPVIAIGQLGAQGAAIPAAHVRLERTGCATRRPMTKSTANGSRRFIPQF
jgi:hypothetical protein